MGDEFEVRGVSAGPGAAEVVQLDSIRNRTMKQTPDHPVSQSANPPHNEGGISMLIQPTAPAPASVGLNRKDDAPEQPFGYGEQLRSARSTPS